MRVYLLMLKLKFVCLHVYIICIVLLYKILTTGSIGYAVTFGTLSLLKH